MPKHRFYLPTESWKSEVLTLVDEEAHHCKDVMRCREGDDIFVFDGNGRVAECKIQSLSKRQVIVEITCQETVPKPSAAITLGQAIPKGKNMELIIQKATELGVQSIVPLISDHTVVQLNAKERAKKQDKWQRVVIEACKQCGQNWMPKIAPIITAYEFIAAAEEEWKLIAAIDDRAEPFHPIFDKLGGKSSSACILIGPEGDLTAAEVGCALEAGFSPASLGPIILRSETAAIYCLSILAHQLLNRD
ncbi:MAG: 16S rRNA (uracil(1498)-N(3))-methyltransferase [Verrucomicrobiota bacterium]